MPRSLLRLLPLAFLLAALPAGAAEPRSDMKVHAANVQIDTLEVPWRDVYKVAMSELEKNDWTIQCADSSQRQFVTHWKKFDHPLSKLVFGDLYARCVVDVTPLSDTTTELRFRGGIAGPPDLDETAAFRAAQSAYRKAAERWVARVRATLAATATAEPVSPSPAVR